MTGKGKCNIIIDTRHWPTYVLNSFKYRFSRKLDLATVSTPNKTSRRLSKRLLVLLTLLSSSYSFNCSALSAQTASYVTGTLPYFTRNNGVTKILTVNDLSAITLSDGTVITAATNPTDRNTAIELPEKNQSFEDIVISLLPPTETSIDVSTVLGAPYNYWGDDEGDGQGDNGIQASGNISVTILDRNQLSVPRNEVLEACKAPYTINLSIAGPVILSTRYGVPNQRRYESSLRVSYVINPKAEDVKLCGLYTYTGEPGFSQNQSKIDGPANLWIPKVGFKIQSTDPSSYDKNFPTTGFDNVGFSLQLSNSGKTTKQLNWSSVTKEGITIDVQDRGYNNITMTLLGPHATRAQALSKTPGKLITPNLPQTFEIVGYDSNNNAGFKYGFVLKNWFVFRNGTIDFYNNQEAWCSNIGYRLPLIKELTNTVSPVYPGISGKPSSSGEYFQYYIGAGLLAEWGTYFWNHQSRGYDRSYWTGEQEGNDPRYHYVVSFFDGKISSQIGSSAYGGVCVYP